MGKYFYDFILPEYGIIIEVDGRYHTDNTNTRDKLKTRKAKNNGYKLIRIKEKEVKHVHLLKNKINKIISQNESM